MSSLPARLKSFINVAVLILSLLVINACGYRLNVQPLQSLKTLSCGQKTKIFYEGRCDAFGLNNCGVDGHYDIVHAKLPEGIWENKSFHQECSHIRKVAAFSAGRVPLLKRMRDGLVSTALLIDPSYDDPKTTVFKYFRKLTTANVIRSWLDSNPSHHFYFIYQNGSDGKDTIVSELSNHPRVKMCYIRGPKSNHLYVAQKVGVNRIHKILGGSDLKTMFPSPNGLCNL